MTHPAKRQRVGFIAVAIVFIVAGCLGASAPRPCTLKVSADEQGVRRVLEPPYKAHLVTATGPVVLLLSGAGWSQMDVTLRNGSGPERSNQLTRENIEANALMRDTNDARGFSLDGPGQWQVRLSDPVSGCVSAFTVEVVP